jgi:prepilin-type N-terminal cleavage/methylation domain-containing protein
MGVHAAGSDMAWRMLFWRNMKRIFSRWMVFGERRGCDFGEFHPLQERGVTLVETLFALAVAGIALAGVAAFNAH